MNYTEIEGKVREATNDEQWGPTGQIMQELAHATFTYEHFPEVMSMLWKRMLQDNKTNWRRTYKVRSIIGNTEFCMFCKFVLLRCYRVCCFLTIWFEMVRNEW